MDFLTKLPNELIIEIFEYCKVLPLTLVCKKFNEVIGNSTTLMRKVSLTVSEKSDGKTLSSSRRKHQSVSFKFNYKISESFVNVLDSYEIKSLELLRCIVTWNVFLKLLKATPELESLSIFTTFLKNVEEMSSFEPPQLTKLKKLNMRNSAPKYLNFLTKAPLEKVLLVIDERTNESTIDFLKQHPSIKAFDYFHVNVIEDTLFTVLIQETKSLDRLHLEADCVDMSCVRDLNVRNTTVKHLNICNTTKMPNDYNRLLEFFKNVKSVEIEMNTALEAGHIVQLQQQWPELESLSITHCRGDYFSYVQFNSLKELVLTDGAYSTDEWSRFASRNQTIEKIIIKDESTSDDIFRTLCNEFRHLKHLEINYDPERLTSDVMNFICDPLFPSNIRFLKIVQRSWPDTSFLVITEQHKQVLNNKLGFHFCLN